MTATQIITCPGDGSVVGEVPILSAADVTEMAARLREAQPAWAALSFAERAHWMHQWRDWFFDNESHLAALVQKESGKSWGDASMETPIAVEVINYYAKHAGEFLAPAHPRPHSPAMLLKKLTSYYEPRPVIGLITPWNGPIGNGMLDLPAMMMAGCSVLSKPSEFTPLTWSECVRGWREDVGAPPILDCATGDGETGAAVVDAVDMVHFTGSVRTGRRIAARCGELLKPCSLELGGKDAFIVCSDANLQRAANAAVWGGFTNAGQNCIAVERVYVEASVYDEFLEKVKAETATMRVGMDSGPEPSTEFGAIATETQLQIIESHVADATAKGAKVVTGGHRIEAGQGLFYEPTVLVDVDHTMECMREETFGPTLPIMKVANDEEAILLANDSPYGLSASVWTRDEERGQRIATQLKVGAVNINNVFINLFQLPLPQGGWRLSGIGARLGGAGGIRKYCATKAVVSERFAPAREPHWYPATAKRMAIVAKGGRFMGAGDWKRKLGRTPDHSYAVKERS